MVPVHPAAGIERYERLGIAAGRGSDAGDGHLTVVVSVDVAVPLGVKRRQHEVSVRVAVPSPVDVIESVPLVSVADKCVGIAPRVSHTAIQHGASGGQLAVYQLIPLTIGIVFAHPVCGAHVISEVISEEPRDTDLARARRRGRVFHVHPYAAGQHQACHLLALGIGGILAIRVPEAAPVERRGAIVELQLVSVAAARIRSGAGALRPLVVVEYLGQRRGHAAGDATDSGILGTQHVVRGPLPPFRGQHGGDGRVIAVIGVGLGPLRREGILIYPPLHGGGDVVGVESLHVSQHGGREIVGGREQIAVGPRKDVCRRGVGCPECMRQSHSGAAALGSGGTIGPGEACKRLLGSHGGTPSRRSGDEKYRCSYYADE